MTEKPYKDKGTEIEDCDAKTITTDRWALDNGLATVTMQETLVYYGYLAHEKAVDVLVIINPKEGHAKYIVTLTSKEHKRYKKFLKKLDRYVKSGNVRKQEQLRIDNFKINLEGNLRRLVAEYLPKLEVSIEIKEKRLLPKWVARLLGLKAYVERYNDFF